VTTPSDTILGQVIYATVTFHTTNYYSNYNMGNIYNFNAYVCRDDDSNCVSMYCTGPYGDYGPTYSNYYGYYGQNTISYTCSMTANELNTHKIRVDFNGCYAGAYYSQTIDSGTFKVTSYKTCSAGYTGNYQCAGSWQQQSYQNSDCSIQWQNSQYCNNGCSNGQCLQSASKGTPEITTDEQYTVQNCKTNKIQFSIGNVGTVTDTFSISFSGSAGGWMNSVSSVTLDAGQTKTITAYASVPCSAEGDYDLKISATDGDNSSTVTVLSVAQQGFTFTGWADLINWAGLSTAVFYILLALLVLGIILLILYFMEKPGRRKRGGEEPESFRQKNTYRKNGFVRERPESFAEKYCGHLPLRI
jgi:hypothetical protein